MELRYGDRERPLGSGEPLPSQALGSQHVQAEQKERDAAKNSDLASSTWIPHSSGTQPPRSLGSLLRERLPSGRQEGLSEKRWRKQRPPGGGRQRLTDGHGVGPFL